MDITISKADRGDIEAISGMWYQFMEEELPDKHSGENILAQKQWHERLKQQIKQDMVIIACDTSNNLCGFLAFIDSAYRKWIPQHVAYVVDIYVKPQARNSIAARALFQYLRKNIPAKYNEVWTNTRIENKRMHILLKRAGFREMSSFSIEGLEGHRYYKLQQLR